MTCHRQPLRWPSAGDRIAGRHQPPVRPAHAAGPFMAIWARRGTGPAVGAAWRRLSAW